MGCDQSYWACAEYGDIGFLMIKHGGVLFE
jgi:hypothetical protein